MIKILRSVAAGAVLSLSAATSLFSAECIAPANPGGGWDFTCRTITKIMYDIGAVDSPIQVTNMAGGGGGLAYGHVVNERNSDDNLIVAASSATATRLAQNAYSGMTYDQVLTLAHDTVRELTDSDLSLSQRAALDQHKISAVRHKASFEAP